MTETDSCSPCSWSFSPKHEDDEGNEGGEDHGDNDGGGDDDDGDGGSDQKGGTLTAKAVWAVTLSRLRKLGTPAPRRICRQLSTLKLFDLSAGSIDECPEGA